ncbi:MAG: type II toxin-antitoxin system mRNA interferase toxin, RelE/StbE family [Actinophytocola sp.]|nr:type II toxin-antitoxin system mRNA interferase toxin, RelE/StbE family [Actinophytocola sp.]
MRKLPRDIAARIKTGTEALRENQRPAGVKSLAGKHGLWRIRIGDYRVVYEIRDNELLVLVIRVAHRREVYRKR